jgi:hypothetical protein
MERSHCVWCDHVCFSDLAMGQKHFETVGELVTKRSTFGPAYSEPLDGERIHTQFTILLIYMLAEGRADRWHSLAEIETYYKKLHPFARPCPQASISAQLRHMRKPQFGSYILEKRRRPSLSVGTWEYKLSVPPTLEQLGQQNLFGENHAE